MLYIVIITRLPEDVMAIKCFLWILFLLFCPGGLRYRGAITKTMILENGEKR
jgi:hypothetical protein